jgi:hypothetical protein
MINITSRGDWGNTARYLQRMQSMHVMATLDKYGQKGVAALSAATPVESSETASSWTYEIVKKAGYYAIHWSNNHMEDGVSIAAILQYGHGTGTGGYVQGRDYINPALRPIFDQMINEFWREVTK